MQVALMLVLMPKLRTENGPGAGPGNLDLTSYSAQPRLIFWRAGAVA
jgi:hypothetical protein